MCYRGIALVRLASPSDGDARAKRQRHYPQTMKETGVQSAQYIFLTITAQEREFKRRDI